MKLFVILSFLFLGWLYWELSGGADFVPETAATETPAETPAEADVTLAVAEVPADGGEAAPLIASAVSPAEAPAVEAPAEAEALQAAAALPAPAPEAAAPEAPAVEVTRADSSLDTIAAAARPVLPEGPLAPGEALAAIAPELAGRIEDAVAAALVAPEAAPEGGTDVAAAGGAANGANGLRLVTGDRVNMRAGPGTGFEVVGQLVAGQRAEVLEAEGNWLRVRGEGGAEGWMSARFLAPLSDG